MYFVLCKKKFKNRTWEIELIIKISVNDIFFPIVFITLARRLLLPYSDACAFHFGSNRSNRNCPISMQLLSWLSLACLSVPNDAANGMTSSTGFSSTFAALFGSSVGNFKDGTFFGYLKFFFKNHGDDDDGVWCRRRRRRPTGSAKCWPSIKRMSS